MWDNNANSLIGHTHSTIIATDMFSLNAPLIEQLLDPYVSSIGSGYNNLLPFFYITDVI